MKKILVVLAVLLTTLSCVTQVTSDKYDHRYSAGDRVPCYARPNNTRETYSYFDLPCSDRMSQIWNGDHGVASDYRLNFRESKRSTLACVKTLEREQVSQFRTAVSRSFYFQMYCDDLQIQQLIGFIDNTSVVPKYFMYNHIHFDVYYNKDRVIEINTRAEDQPVELIEDSKLSVIFMYSVNWERIDAPFEKRMEKYSVTQAAMIESRASYSANVTVGSSKEEEGRVGGVSGPMENVTLAKGETHQDTWTARVIRLISKICDRWHSARPAAPATATVEE